MGGPRISFPRQHYKGGREGDTTFAILNIFIAQSSAEPRTGKQLTACVWYFCPTGYLKSLSRLGRLKPTQFLSMPSNWLGLCEDYNSQHKNLLNLSQRIKNLSLVPKDRISFTNNVIHCEMKSDPLKRLDRLRLFWDCWNHYSDSRYCINKM